MLTLLLLAEEAGAPASPFEVNFGIFFWTWLVFITLFFVLKRYAWPAIVRATEERERSIREHLAKAEQANTKAERLAEENQQLLAEARTSAQQLIGEAKQAADKERVLAVERTKKEQDALLERARRDIAAERDKAIVQLRAEAVDLSLAAASKLIEERLSDDADRRLVEGYLKTLEARRSNRGGTRH
ncbi:MAG: F0F1 ATP synthase subunit B [Gemmatimonadales bacterium]|nr:F0F1 ATP synthase subunit B [Gemmatimonadales bacterium]